MFSCLDNSSYFNYPPRLSPEPHKYPYSHDYSNTPWPPNLFQASTILQLLVLGETTKLTRIRDAEAKTERAEEEARQREAETKEGADERERVARERRDRAIMAVREGRVGTGFS